MDYSSFPNMIFERRDPGILWITLSKPEKLNTADAKCIRLWRIFGL